MLLYKKTTNFNKYIYLKKPQIKTILLVYYFKEKKMFYEKLVINFLSLNNRSEKKLFGLSKLKRYIFSFQF